VRNRKPSSNHLRYLLLAIRLQRQVEIRTGSIKGTESRISYKSLTSDYFESGISSSISAAEKMARRDVAYIENIFGLTKTQNTGFFMARKFNRFRDMFSYWLDSLGEPEKCDRRMHVMLSGIIAAIDNGFRDDPVIVPDLAQKLKRRYGNKNTRDSLEPLVEIFDHHLISAYLGLVEDNNGALHINNSANAILMKLRPAKEVGTNADISINLVFPGQRLSKFDKYISETDGIARLILNQIADAVFECRAWETSDGIKVVPYILYKEGETGPFILTYWQANDCQYRDIHVNQIKTFPSEGKSLHIPFQMSPKLWALFGQSDR